MVQADYQVTKTGDKGMPDYAVAKDFKVVWSHRQDRRAKAQHYFFRQCELFDQQLRAFQHRQLVQRSGDDSKPKNIEHQLFPQLPPISIDVFREPVILRRPCAVHL